MKALVDQLKPVLSAIAPAFVKQADTLLDLREAALRGEKPGRCVNCYFKLLAVGSRGGRAPVLTPLRRWLEAHIEVVAQDASEREIERAPLAIEEGESLEAFAERLMGRYQADRGDLPEQVYLHFAYREAARAV